MALSEKAMVEPLEEEAAVSAAGEACFADELVLLDFNDELYNPPIGAASSSYSSTAAAVAGELERQALFFQDLFEPSVDGLPVPPQPRQNRGLPAEGAGGGDEEEEELEWLVNKDAFPGLETSFEIPAHSHSSSGGSAAVGAVGERPSSVSFLAAAAASLSVPVRRRSKGRRRRRTVLTGLSQEHATMAVARVAATPANRRRCRHCEAEETPQWRAGPEGPKTLCNACGVRYKSGRLVPEYRPASSPTFSAAVHSNSHRRILEMRRQKTTGERRSTRAPSPPRTLITPPVV